MSECFKLNGYPEWYKELKKGQERARIHYVDYDMHIMSDG